MKYIKIAVLILVVIVFTNYFAFTLEKRKMGIVNETPLGAILEEKSECHFKLDFREVSVHEQILGVSSEPIH
jgi:hypothetical protein